VLCTNITISAHSVNNELWYRGVKLFRDIILEYKAFILSKILEVGDFAETGSMNSISIVVLFLRSIL